MSTTIRRSRMRRTRTGKRIELTARDLAIFRLLSRFRYLRSNLIHACVGGRSQTRFIERLGDLYHEGFLDRPAQQWEFAYCRFLPTVHEIGARGRRVLDERGEPGVEPVTFLSKSGHQQFQHALMICDVLAVLELAARRDGRVRFIAWPEILAKAPLATRTSAHALQLPAGPREGAGLDRGPLPDGLFGLEYSQSGAKTYRFFALEIDRGTMPVSRTNALQTSYVGKILNYHSALSREAHRHRWGLPNLLVLTVTLTEPRMMSIMSALNQLPVCKSVFLFATCTPRCSSRVSLGRDASLPLQTWGRVGLPPMSIVRPDSV